jgi:Leucine-rich repeat (LRR) protein
MIKMELNNENCIEWLSGQHNIICSISQQKYITKIKKLAEKYPKKVKIKFNKDGTICAKLPIKALKLSIIERELSEEQRQEMSRRFKERMYKED